jgi:hypothetical protein
LNLKTPAFLNFSPLEYDQACEKTLSEHEIRLAATNDHYLRNPFSVAKLSRMLGMQ